MTEPKVGLARAEFLHNGNMRYSPESKDDTTSAFEVADFPCEPTSAVGEFIACRPVLRWQTLECISDSDITLAQPDRAQCRAQGVSRAIAEKRYARAVSTLGSGREPHNQKIGS